MDNLARDAITATRMGMSYGYWKAEHPNTKREPPKKVEGDEIIIRRKCAICGKEFIVTKAHKVTCSEECRNERDVQHKLAYGKRWRKEQKKNKEAMNEG